MIFKNSNLGQTQPPTTASSSVINTTVAFADNDKTIGERRFELIFILF